MECPNFCCDPKDDVSPCLILFSKKVTDFDFDQVIYFTFFATPIELSPHDYVGKPNSIFFFFISLIE